MSFDVTLGTLGHLKELVEHHLLNKRVYFDGHCLYQSNEMALGSGFVTLTDFEMLGIVAVSLSFTFEVEEHRVQRYLVIPIMQESIPEFTSSVVGVDPKQTVLTIFSHVVDSRNIEKRFNFEPEKRPFGFMAVRFILNENLVRKIS
jgi:hypothetical protein